MVHGLLLSTLTDSLCWHCPICAHLQDVNLDVGSDLTATICMSKVDIQIPDSMDSYDSKIGHKSRQ